MRLFDGQHHSVDSSEIAFKLAGAQAMSEALEQADPVLLEPIMLVTLSVPEAYVGDVIGDLNSRRGRPQGMEPSGAMTEIKAEVPMAEMLTYAPDLRSITGGQGDYTLEFLRYEEVPAHLAQKVVDGAPGERASDARLTAGLLDGPQGYAAGLMATRSIVTSQPDVACDVCERRLLRGEQPDVFLDAGEPRMVCELCAPRAAHQGWLRGSDQHALSAAPLPHAAVGGCSNGCARRATLASAKRRGVLRRRRAARRRAPRSTPSPTTPRRRARRAAPWRRCAPARRPSRRRRRPPVVVDRPVARTPSTSSTRASTRAASRA